MSEKVPEPEVPVSSRKLSDSPFESCVSESSEEYDSFEEAKGYRVVPMDSLRKFIQRIHGPCASGKKLYETRRLLTHAQAFTRATDFCKAPLNESPLYMVLYKVLRCKIENLM